MKLHKLIIAIAAALVLMVAPAAGAQAQADTAAIISKIEAAGRIHVIIPEGLSSRLQPDSNSPAEVAEEESETAAPAQTAHRTSAVGYRVQVFDDNNVRTAKHEAENRKRQMESRFPEFRVYMQFNSPYWRVKVGDFRTRSEAEAAMAAIKSAFPGLNSQLRVVRDHINR